MKLSFALISSAIIGVVSGARIVRNHPALSEAKTEINGPSVLIEGNTDITAQDAALQRQTQQAGVALDAPRHRRARRRHRRHVIAHHALIEDNASEIDAPSVLIEGKADLDLPVHRRARRRHRRHVRRHVIAHNAIHDSPGAGFTMITITMR